MEEGKKQQLVYVLLHGLYSTRSRNEVRGALARRPFKPVTFFKLLFRPMTRIKSFYFVLE